MAEENIGGAVVRYHEDATVDEIVAEGAFVHLEQMGDTETWLGVTMPNGVRVCIWIAIRDGKLVQTRHE